MGFLDGLKSSYKQSIKEGTESVTAGLLSALRGRLSSFGISMPIGSLGDIVFEVSGSKVITFKDLQRTTQARYASHEIIGQKPILEYLGPGGEEITFTMQFSISLGVNPAKETEKIRKLCETGEAMYFVLCNQLVGANQWVIESVSEAVNAVDNNGRIIVTQLDVTIKEYIPSIGQVKA